MNGIIYSVLTLQTDGAQNPLGAMFEGIPLEHNNHVHNFDQDKPKSFDYMHGGVNVETSKTYVSARGLALTGLRVGEDGEDTDSSLRKVIHNLLAINSVSTEEEQKLSSYLQLAYVKVFNKITSRSLLSIEVRSSQPKFIILTKNMPVYFLALVDDHASYLVWSNEATLEQRVKETFGEKFYLYRLPTYSNGVCVIQSNFLDKKFVHWNRQLRDKLKVMNALEAHLRRRWIVQLDTPVNNSTGTDHPVLPSTLGS